MAEWIKELLLLTAAEFHARPIVGALATVDADGRPHARTVILRQISAGDGGILIATDARSAKVAQVQHRPEGELVVWTAHERAQFRVAGRIEVVREGEARLEQWQALSDVNRAMYSWPAPGEPCRAGDAFTPAVGPATPPPESFVLLRIHAERVECLELNERPHRRRLWRKGNGWAEERVNP